MHKIGKYTVLGDEADYTRTSKLGGCVYLDSENNIFPTAVALAKYHGVSPATVQRIGKAFKSKTLNKKVAADCFSFMIDLDVKWLFDVTREQELINRISVYDELFNNYILKGIPATMAGEHELYQYPYNGKCRIKLLDYLYV